MESVDILYQDNHLVAINKPHGWVTHPSPMARNARYSAMKQLRDQLDTYVFPCHRLDSKTSGILLFALSKSQHRIVSDLFMQKKVIKTYLAIVRGYTADKTTIDYPLINDKGKSQDAITHVHTLQRSEIPLPYGKYETSRYSLVKVMPETGRKHQIRKHLSHIRNPIIGDRPHGCNKQNRLFKEKWNMTSMLLHAYALEIPELGLQLKASPSHPFLDMYETLGFHGRESIIVS